MEYDKDVVGEAKQAMGPKTEVLKSNQRGRLDACALLMIYSLLYCIYV